jgi:UDP-N-acetylglucosamine 2-epimerase
MQNAFFIITDSGGVQEEAAYLSKYTRQANMYHRVLDLKSAAL